MDSHVKERIVGAAILVALGVWLIPWLLDGPETELATPESVPALVLPSADETAAIRTETVEIVESSSRPAASLPAQGSEDAAAVRSEPPPAVVRTEPAPAVPSPPEEQSAAALPAPPVSAPAAASGAWSVQVGAFTERASATQLASRVDDYGYRAQVTEFRSNGVMMHRVRVAGFATREQAEVASSSLSAHGIPGRVVPTD